jgi:hypothetical protein
MEELMELGTLINPNVDTLYVFDLAGERVVRELLGHGLIGHFAWCDVRLSDWDCDGTMIPMYGHARQRVIGLPKQQPGITYVVSQHIADTHRLRKDLVVPSHWVVGERGEVIGCRGLSIPNHPAARRTPLDLSTEKGLTRLRRMYFAAEPELSDEAMCARAFELGLVSEVEMDSAL